jgi:hypothetical protein
MQLFRGRNNRQTDFRTVLAEIVQKRLGNSSLVEIFSALMQQPGFLGLAK